MQGRLLPFDWLILAARIRKIALQDPFFSGLLECPGMTEKGRLSRQPLSFCESRLLAHPGLAIPAEGVRCCKSRRCYDPRAKGHLCRNGRRGVRSVLIGCIATVRNCPLSSLAGALGFNVRCPRTYVSARLRGLRRQIRRLRRKDSCSSGSLIDLAHLSSVAAWRVK